MEVLWFIILALIGGFAGLFVFCYALKKGAFEDIEDPKYQMFRQEEEEDAQVPK